MIVRQRNMFERYAGPVLGGHYQVMEALMGPAVYHVVDLEKLGDDWSKTPEWEVTSLNGGELRFSTIEEAEAHIAMRAAYEMTHARDVVIEMTMDEIITAAWNKGWFMSILYEMQVGYMWHARFERREAHNAKERPREGSYAPTAIQALWAAFEEIDNPGVNAKRRDTNITREWTKAIKNRGLEKLPLRDNGEPHAKRPKYVEPDYYAMEGFLANEPGIEMKLEEALRCLVKAHGNEVDDEEDWV